MKKPPTVLNTPVRVMFAMLAIMLGGFLTMLLLEGIDTTILKDVVLNKWLFDFIDPCAPVAIGSLALYRLICKPMSIRLTEQVWQHEELWELQKVAVGRILRMEKLAEEIPTLRLIGFPSKKPTTSNSRPILWKNAPCIRAIRHPVVRKRLCSAKTL